MKWVLYILFLIICLMFPAEGVERSVIDAESVQQYMSEFLRRGQVMDQGWTFRPGDDMAWALPELDDRDWEPWTVGSDLTVLPGWQGRGWFRCRFEITPEVQDKSVVLFVGLIGACEIYLDGHLIGEFGSVGHSADTETVVAIANLMAYVPVRFSPGADHVLAVRFSNFRKATRLLSDMPAGFLLIFSEREYSQDLRAQVYRNISIHQMLFAIPLGISLLHLTLFLFNPADRGNLFYALLTISIAGLIYFPMTGTFTFDLDTIVHMEAFFKLSLILMSIFQLWFIYHFFRGTPTLFFKVLVVIGVVLGFFAWTLDVNMYFIFVLLTYPEGVRIIYKAFLQKRPGAEIVGIGLLVFMIGGGYQILMSMRILEQPLLFFPYIYGALGLMLSMSIYLARIFARTYQNLEVQLAQAKDLSALSLAQEREALRLERQAAEDREKRQLLEADNAVKAKELEEARQRQAIYASLQQKHLELQATQDKLIQSEKMASLGNLVAGIAHEINTPVGAINSMHDTLMRAVDRLKSVLETQFSEELAQSRPMRAALKVIGDANRVIATGTERVTEIVRSLRSFARLDEAEMKEVDLHEGIDNTLTLVQHDLKNRVEVVRDYGDIPRVTCFPSRLNQVFLNILVNASQAIEGNGVIVIRTRQVDGQVEITISDTGKGIARENLDRIFDPGFTTKGVGVGTGLGLSICYQIMQDHRGSIEVDSEMGNGTTFTLRLPIAGLQ